MASAGWFGPKDFDECILDSMEGVTSDYAAKLIYVSCRKKFPKIEPEVYEFDLFEHLVTVANARIFRRRNGTLA